MFFRICRDSSRYSLVGYLRDAQYTDSRLFQVDLAIVWKTVRGDLPSLAMMVHSDLEESTQSADLRDGSGSLTPN